jgi:dihydrofolate reductase
MAKIGVFNHVTVDGFFAGPQGEIDWFKAIGKDDEYERYAHGQSSGGSTLLFGRTTYEMMKSYWPTEAAIQNDPHMAAALNDSPKIVFSKALRSVEEGPHWKNVRLLNEIDPVEIRKLKEQAGGGMTLLGSESIVQQFANLDLIDEYQLIVVPIVLGAGKLLFHGVRNQNLKLLEARAFKNGLTSLRYQSAGSD